MKNLNWGLGIGDWGLGIGDWAQSPIPNPQSPGDWGLGIGDWAQSPIPNPQSPIPIRKIKKCNRNFFILN
jgi:hypothetical protein